MNDVLVQSKEYPTSPRNHSLWNHSHAHSCSVTREASTLPCSCSHAMQLESSYPETMPRPGVVSAPPHTQTPISTARYNLGIPARHDENQHNQRFQSKTRAALLQNNKHLVMDPFYLYTSKKCAVIKTLESESAWNRESSPRSRGDRVNKNHQSVKQLYKDHS